MVSGYRKRRLKEIKERDFFDKRHQDRLDLINEYKPDPDLKLGQDVENSIDSTPKKYDKKNDPVYQEQSSRLNDFLKRSTKYEEFFDTVLDPDAPNPAKMYLTMENSEDFYARNEQYIGKAKLPEDIKQEYVAKMATFFDKMIAARKLVDQEAENVKTRVAARAFDAVQKSKEKNKLWKQAIKLAKEAGTPKLVMSEYKKLLKQQGMEDNVNSH